PAIHCSIISERYGNDPPYINEINGRYFYYSFSESAAWLGPGLSTHIGAAVRSGGGMAGRPLP
ncbi:MAG: hypothetical protein AAF699_21760, partial [Pseudomonadota bacterium]